MNPPSISPLLRDITRITLGIWSVFLGFLTILSSTNVQDATNFWAGMLFAVTGLLLVFKKWGMVATIMGTIAVFLGRLDVGVWAWIWLLWPTAKLYGTRKRFFTFGYWFLIFLHVWRWQHNTDQWWSQIELILSMFAVVPLFAPWAWSLLSILMIIIMPFDPDWNIPLIAMHMLTFNMNWIPAKPILFHPIIRIDTKCWYCNKFIDILVREDWAGVFHYGNSHKNANAMIIESPTGVFIGWHAIIYIFSALGGYWPIVAKFLSLVPSRMGDQFYRFIAQNRHRFMKPSEHCQLRTDLGNRWIQ